MYRQADVGARFLKQRKRRRERLGGSDRIIDRCDLRRSQVPSQYLADRFNLRINDDEFGIPAQDLAGERRGLGNKYLHRALQLRDLRQRSIR